MKFNKKYDIAWRPLDISYSDWKNRLFSSAILEKVTVYDASLAEKLKRVDVVVQCVNPSSVYSQTFPELKDKPMLNFDKGSNGAMTLNENYINQRDISALGALGKTEDKSVSFAIVLNDTNKGLHSLRICLETLDTERKQGRLLNIDEEILVNNFVGDTNQNLSVLIGRYHFSRVAIK